MSVWNVNRIRIEIWKCPCVRASEHACVRALGRVDFDVEAVAVAAAACVAFPRLPTISLFVRALSLSLSVCLSVSLLSELCECFCYGYLNMASWAPTAIWTNVSMFMWFVFVVVVVGVSCVCVCCEFLLLLLFFYRIAKNVHFLFIYWWELFGIFDDDDDDDFEMETKKKKQNGKIKLIWIVQINVRDSFVWFCCCCFERI